MQNDYGIASVDTLKEFEIVYALGVVKAKEDLAKKLLEKGYDIGRMEIAEEHRYNEETHTMEYRCWPVFK